MVNNKIELKKKKKGFTLIEMVAVVAIIGILAAILVPKITGYINEAKKTAVIDQARKVSQAYETAKMKGNLVLKNGTTAFTEKSTLDTVLGDTGSTTMKSLIADSDLGNLGFNLNGTGGTNQSTITIEHCIAITEGSDFTINSSEVLVLTSVTTK